MTDPRILSAQRLVSRLAAGELAARCAPNGAEDDMDALLVGLNRLAAQLEAARRGALRDVSAQGPRPAPPSPEDVDMVRPPRPRAAYASSRSGVVSIARLGPRDPAGQTAGRWWSGSRLGSAQPGT